MDFPASVSTWTSRAGHDCHLVTFQENDAAGMLHDGRNIGGDEVFPLAKADHDATGVADAGADDLIGLIRRHQDDAVRTLDGLEGPAGGFDQVQAGSLVLFHQLDDRLGIRIRLEGHAFGGQFVAQFQEILDDAVMDDDDTRIGAQMGMGVAGSRNAVGGPAGMADTRRTAEGCLSDQFNQAG